VREGIYKVINAENYDKGAMVAQVVRHAWYKGIEMDLGSSLVYAINVMF